jgi:DNA gyrase/topoisomerase IV subunit B
MTTAATSYGAEAIKRLEGMEAIRRLPGMYIGNNSVYGLHHILMEPIDNSVDEILNGHGNTIEVVIHSDGSASIKDNCFFLPRIPTGNANPTRWRDISPLGVRLASISEAASA